jgi:hypothetical protein
VKKIAVVIGGPFNSGIFATGVKADAHYNYGPAPDEVKDRVQPIQHICKSFKVSLPEAALRSARSSCNPTPPIFADLEAAIDRFLEDHNQKTQHSP